MIEKIDLMRLSDICDEVLCEPVTLLSLSKKLNEVIDAVNKLDTVCFGRMTITNADGCLTFHHEAPRQPTTLICKPKDAETARKILAST